MKANETINTSQVVIIDQEKNIYVENNRYWCLAFFWWKAESWEKAINTAIRELKQEIGIVVFAEDLIELENDLKKLKHGTFNSTLYLLNISNKVWEQIKRIKDTVKITMQDLEKSEQEFMTGKKDFLRRIKLALENNQS